jgi:hypothetical protein
MNFLADAALGIFKNFLLSQILSIKDQQVKFGKEFVELLKQKLQLNT